MACFMKIGFLGSTGLTGKELINQALKAGYEIKAFARSPARSYGSTVLYYTALLNVVSRKSSNKACSDLVKAARFFWNSERESAN